VGLSRHAWCDHCWRQTDWVVLFAVTTQMATVGDHALG
jgi:hypothetical protein